MVMLKYPWEIFSMWIFGSVIDENAFSVSKIMHSDHMDVYVMSEFWAAWGASVDPAKIHSRKHVINIWALIA